MNRSISLTVAAVVAAAATACGAPTASDSPVDQPSPSVSSSSPAPDASDDDTEIGTDDVATEPPSVESTDPGPGDPVVVADWEVTIEQVETDADAIIAAANQFNDPPSGRYILVTYEATYTGSDRTADAYMDLYWSFTTADQQVVDEAYAVTPSDTENWTTGVRSGGSARAQIVIDVAPEKISGGFLSVEAGWNGAYAAFRPLA